MSKFESKLALALLFGIWGTQIMEAGKRGAADGAALLVSLFYFGWAIKLAWTERNA